MSQMFGGGGGGSSTTSSGLPEGFGWVAPGMQGLFRTMTSLLSGGQSPYPYSMPDQQVAGFNPMQQNALSLLGGKDMRRMGKAGIGALTDIENGKYMDPNNKVLTDTINSMNQQTSANYMDAIAPNTESQFISAGSPGGSAYNNARNANQYSLATELSNNANQIKGQNYTNNLNLMEQAPSEFQNAASPYQTMLGAGNQKQQQRQNVLSTDYQNKYNRATWPFQAMSMIQNLLQGTTGFGGITKAMSGGGGMS